MIIDRYIFWQLFWTGLFVALTLAAIILLTQSLRFLELVIDSGASGTAFWILTLLALPRFFEIILPLALSISVLFIYNRLTQDSEIAVMRSAGLSPMRLARPAIRLAVLTSALLFVIVGWIGPSALAALQEMRQFIKAEYSALVFREGVFNELGDNVTVYIRERGVDGALMGLLIHDTRAELPAPVTIIAQRGLIVEADKGQQVVVYDGVRQSLNPETGILSRLDFAQYSLDLPQAEGGRDRWVEPDERTFTELFSPDLNNQSDVRQLDAFRAEIHRRISAPFLAVGFCLVGLCCLLLGSVNRQGQGQRIFLAAFLILCGQAAMLGAQNLAVRHPGGIILMYSVALFPILIAGFLLSAAGEDVRRKLFFTQTRRAQEVKI